MSASTSLKIRPPATDNLATFLYPCFERLDLKSCHQPPLLAVSGGPDSMALAYAFASWWRHERKQGIHSVIHAAVVDHGLRPESSAEAKVVAKRLEELGIKPMILTVSADKPTSGLQDWARRQRYNLLADAALSLGRSTGMITAHHAGDQAETVAMRLGHSSGLRGLAGMGSVSRFKGVKVFRPLIDIPPEKLHSMLNQAGIAYVDDPSNQDCRFERIRMRQMLALPDMPQNSQLLRLGVMAGQLNHALNTLLSEELEGAWGISEFGIGWVDKKAFETLPSMARNLVIDGFVRAIGVSSQPRRESARGQLGDTLLKGNGATLGGCEWQSHKDRIICFREFARAGQKKRVIAGQWSVFGGNWHVMAPQDGTFSALGSTRLPQVRRLYPALLALKDAPARAFWSLPVFTPDSKGDALDKDMQLPALEDGSIIPHLYGSNVYLRETPFATFVMGASLDWMSIRKERL